MMREVAVKAAKQVGRLLLSYQNKPIPGVRKKQGKSLVTSVDLKSEAIVIRTIKQSFPDHTIVSEESHPDDSSHEHVWCIDPIDGTHNFIRGIPIYGVSIAYLHKGIPQVGVILLPELKKLYVAERGKGATCNGKKIRVSKQTSLAFSYLHFGSSFQGRSPLLRMQVKTENELYSERLVGCAVYEAVTVAEGKADGMVLFKTNAWDVAAGGLLIQEAGGRVTNFKSRKWNVFSGDFIGSNGNMHRHLLKAVKNV